jgi:alkyl hydroperoxide reductase subunit AhpC
VGRNAAESLRQVQDFQHVRNSGGTEATPSGWRPGKVTINPGPDLVGNEWINGVRFVVLYFRTVR